MWIVCSTTPWCGSANRERLKIIKMTYVDEMQQLQFARRLSSAGRLVVYIG